MDEEPASSKPGISRRTMLKSIVGAGIGAALPFHVPARDKSDWKRSLLDYLDALRRPDGGYAWPGQEDSHLTPTFATVGCFHLLQRAPPNKAQLVEFVRNHHPAQVRKLEQEQRIFNFEQLQTLASLDADLSGFRDRIISWKGPVKYLRQYEQHGWPVFRSEAGAILCRKLLGLSPDELPQSFRRYLDARRRPNGSFNNGPTSEGGDGHVTNTYWGLLVMNWLGRAGENKAAAIQWLQDCQLSNGGFTYQPRPEFGGVDDVSYTRAAVCALALLGSETKNPGACIKYLWSLRNADGGFGDRPGWNSNPVATHYALEALAALRALESAPIYRPKRKQRIAVPSGLRVFTIQIEAHGTGSPSEAVDLARSLRIHLWGAKNAMPAWLKRAQAIADEQQVPVRFFISNEEYGTWMNLPGFGTYSHMSDLIAPACADYGASLARKEAVSWKEFRQRRLVPLAKANGRLVWQFGENEELVRIVLDDSLERGGYAAISTFHFGNRDFTETEPFLNRYRGQIPFVALQDAHGKEPWWFADMTAGFRTVFLAKEPTWEGWLDALRENRVAAIRRDAASGFRTWMHAGSDEVAQFVKEHACEWQWWDNSEIQRPLVSIVAVRPEDEFEEGRPGSGIVLRVRCAWGNTTQGLPKKPIAELVKLTVNGVEVAPKLVAKKRANGALEDHYHTYHIQESAVGRQSATATVKALASGTEASRTLHY